MNLELSSLDVDRLVQEGPLWLVRSVYNLVFGHPKRVVAMQLVWIKLVRYGEKSLTVCRPSRGTGWLFITSTSSNET